MARKKPDTLSADQPAPAACRTLTITSARAGFRRAGRAWSSEPTTVDASEFSAEQLAMLMAEPMLTVEELDPA